MARAYYCPSAQHSMGTLVFVLLSTGEIKTLVLKAVRERVSNKVPEILTRALMSHNSPGGYSMNVSAEGLRLANQLAIRLAVPELLSPDVDSICSSCDKKEFHVQMDVATMAAAIPAALQWVMKHEGCPKDWQSSISSEVDFMGQTFAINNKLSRSGIRASLQHILTKLYEQVEHWTLTEGCGEG